MVRGRAWAAAALTGLAGLLFAGEAAPKKQEAPKADEYLFRLPRDVHFYAWKLDVSGETRLREESWNDADLNRRANDRDGRLFLRTRLKLDAQYSNWLRVVLEGVDNREWESARHPPPQQDELDLHQAYVQFDHILDQPLMVRLGRQELDLGSRRLVAAPTWNNLLRSFDAARVSWTSDDFDLHAFGGSVVVPVDDQFNEHKHGERFFGLYSTLKTFSPHKLDLYALGLVTRGRKLWVTGEDGRMGDHERYTVGTRLYGNLTPRWTYDLELARQFGHYARDTIRAWAFHADTAYTLDLPWKPTLQPLFHYASGDRDPKDGIRGTFHPLFTATHAMYGGIMDQVTWMNLKSLGTRLKVTPVPKLTITAEAHRYWLAERSDAWYLGSKQPARRDKAGQSGDSIGHELGLVIRYAVSKQLEFEGGLARFFPGGFVRTTGPHDNADFFYLQTILRF